MVHSLTPLASTSPQGNAGLTRLLVRVPGPVRETFTLVQLEALAFATAAVETRHVVAERRTFGFFGSHFYFAFFLGRCRRHRPTRLERFIHRGLKHSRRYRAAKYVALSCLALAGMTGLIVWLYVLKSALHIDMLAGPSILHDLVF